MLKIANMYVYEVNMKWGTADTDKTQQIIFDNNVGFVFRKDEIEPVRELISIMLKIPRGNIVFEFIDKEEI